MMLRHNTGKLGSPSYLQSIGADPGVVHVAGVAPREGGSSPEQRAEQSRRQRLEENREAAVDHRELGAALADVVEERRLLEQKARLGFEVGHGIEHVEPVSLVVDRQTKEQGSEIGSENPFGVHRLSWAYLRRRVAPELADTMTRRAHHR